MAGRVDAAGVRGIWPMLYAYFDADGGLDRGLMRRQVEAAVASGAAGVACLGLATEVGKLATGERRQLLEWVTADLAGRLPLAVTLAESSIAGQADFAAAAAEAGASFVILQPPPLPGLAEIEYLRFFGGVAERCALPVAIQNAPAFIGIGLSAEGLATLNRNHANIGLLKAEASAVEVAALIERTGGVFRVMNGRDGLELPDNLRAGCVGMVPGMNLPDRQVAIQAAWDDGDAALADRLYAEAAPVIGFLMQGIPHLLAYGKRLTALRLGLPLEAVHDRAPAATPSAFGLACTRRFAEALGPLRLGSG